MSLQTKGKKWNLDLGWNSYDGPYIWDVLSCPIEQEYYFALA